MPGRPLVGAFVKFNARDLVEEPDDAPGEPLRVGHAIGGQEITPAVHHEPALPPAASFIICFGSPPAWGWFFRRWILPLALGLSFVRMVGSPLPFHRSLATPDKPKTSNSIALSEQRD
jgi:hypothetical protein